LRVSSRFPEPARKPGRRPYIQTAETFPGPVASNSSTEKLDPGELGVHGEKRLRVRMGASYTPQGKRLRAG
jgi:hypothetical protein